MRIVLFILFRNKFYLLQARKRALAKAQPYWYPNLRPPAFRTVRKQFCCLCNLVYGILLWRCNLIIHSEILSLTIWETAWFQLIPNLEIDLGMFSYTNQFSNSLYINWMSNNSLQFWHYLSGVTIRSPKLQGLSPTRLPPVASFKAPIVITN